MTENTLTISAAEANRRFSKLLKAARAGARITITSHGEPVAVIGPAEAGSGGRAVLDDLEAHWRSIEPVTIGSWNRDELYDRRS